MDAHERATDDQSKHSANFDFAFGVIKHGINRKIHNTSEHAPGHGANKIRSSSIIIRCITGRRAAHSA